jgi:hypothetical protein
MSEREQLIDTAIAIIGLVAMTVLFLGACLQ